MNMSTLVDSLGWTLLHFVWQGLLIGCATALALALLRNARPEWRYNAACSGLLACLLWPAAELCLRLQGGDMVTAQMRFADALLASGSSGAPAGLMAWLQSQLLWIVAFWALCAAVLALRLSLGLLWICRAERTQRTDARLQGVVSRLAIRFGVGRAVQLRVVEHLDSPVTAGWWRPVVLVPAALVSGMPHELLEALLAHEMAHVRRLDYLVNLGQNVIEILLFYHPAMWWVSRRVRAEREQIADDLAARYSCEARVLAHALSELERMQFSGAHLAIAANGGDLLSRIRRLVRPDTQAFNWKAAIPVLGLAAACLGVYAHASVRSHSAPPKPALGTTPVIADRAPMADFRSCRKPDWPAGALAAEHTGTVTLAFKIGADGKANASRVVRSSGYRDLDQSARLGIQQCQFKPGIKDGKVVETWMNMQYVWTLG